MRVVLPSPATVGSGEALLDSVPHAGDEHTHAWVAEARRRVEAIERAEAELLDLDSALDRLSADLKAIHGK